jgi:hypothetical protein
MDSFFSKTKNSTIFCNSKVKYVSGYAPLWLHHKIEKKGLEKGASLELDEAKFSLEKPM